MSMFSFISDEKLIWCIRKVLEAADNAEKRAESDLELNVLDPFAALFAVTHSNTEIDDWKKSEKDRQIQKSIQNSIGEFHQNLLGSFNGWNNTGRGGSIDLVNEKKKIIAEVKNKHNTMNSSSSNDTYHRLADHIKYARKDYTAYLVQIVPKNSKNYDQPWSPNAKTLALRPDIRRIDGESFYDLASGEKNTLKRIFDSIPKIVSEIRKSKYSPNVIKECRELFIKTYK